MQTGGGITRKRRRMQRLLYWVMALLGTYILGKGGGFVLDRPAVQEAMARQEAKRRLEDMVIRTLMPGYTAAVQGWTVNWMAWLLEPTLPVYGYLASQTMQEKGEAGTDASVEERQAASEEPEHSEEAEHSEETKYLQETEYSEETEHSEEMEYSQEPELPQETAPGEAAGEGQKTIQEDKSAREAVSTAVSPDLLQQLSDYDYLLNQYFTVDAGTTADAELLDASKLLTEDLSIRKNPQVPQILIYHTHSQEEFVDSVPGDTETSIVGMGEVLAEALRGYGYQVIHDTGVYDLIDGVPDRSAAYDYARVAVENILQEYPTIEVIIDLHRDGVDGQKFVTEIDGKPTSMIMFFNGISRNSQDEPIAYLANPYTQQNLAFSLQLELAAREKYPGYTRNIYLKAERFNLHLRPRSLPVEAGTQLNTVEEEKNAMQPLADLLHEVLN